MERVERNIHSSNILKVNQKLDNGEYFKFSFDDWMKEDERLFTPNYLNGTIRFPTVEKLDPDSVNLNISWMQDGYYILINSLKALKCKFNTCKVIEFCITLSVLSKACCWIQDGEM